MKITIISSNHISAHYGGNEQYTHQLSVGLQLAGHEITYITSNAMNTSNYPYSIITCALPRILDNPIPSLTWQQEIISSRPDIIHATGSGIPLITASAWAKYHYNIPTVLTFQAPSNTTSTILKLPAAIEMEAIPRAFTHIITTTSHNQQLLKKRWPWADITHIPMMLSPHYLNTKLIPSKARQQLRLPKNKKLILFIGKLDSHHYYKNFDILLPTLQQLPENYHLLAIGSGDLKSKYQSQIASQALDDKITLLGFISEEKMVSYMKAADVFVLPSNSSSEGFGLVLIEAMACSTPTITTSAIGSATELKAYTQIVPPNDVEALTKAIKLATNKPNKKQIISARKYAHTYTIDRMVNQTSQLYLSLIN